MLEVKITIPNEEEHRAHLFDVMNAVLSTVNWSIKESRVVTLNASIAVDIKYTEESKTPERLEEIASNDTTIGFLAKELQDLKITVDIHAGEIHATKEPGVRLDEGLNLPDTLNLVIDNSQRYLFIKSVADHGMLSAMIKSEGLDQLKGSVSFNQAIDELISKDTWGKHEGC